MSVILPHELRGNKESDKLLVFMHGWPDTMAVWNDVIPGVEQHAYVLNLSYPNFSEKETNPKGIAIEELMKRIKVTIDEMNDTKRKIMIVSHDWGTVFSYWFDHTYPNYVSEIVSLDVGLHAKITPFMAFYQSFLALAFVIGGSCGKTMTQWMVRKFNYQPAWLSRIDGSWNYPYYDLFRMLVTGKAKRIPLGTYEPSCNIAFMYGTNQSQQFYGQRWLDFLAKNPNNEVHALNCGHWIQREQATFVIELIKRRLNNLRELN